MKKVNFAIVTTKDSFVFGFSWRNDLSHRWRASLIIGFIVIEIMWNKPLNQ